MTSVNDKSLLAFVHIEKAAGTTLIHILRRSFFLKYLDVRPMYKTDNEIFSARSLHTYLKINPNLAAFGGHAVRPIGDLPQFFPNVRFITVLRDPVERFLSQYHYGYNKLNRKISFEAFLDNPCNHDFQTKKLCDNESLESAKFNLKEKFVAVGLAEEFNSFLLLLKRECPNLEVEHEMRNQGTRKSVNEDPLFAKHGHEIMAANAKDIALIDYIKKEIIPKRIESYGANYAADLELLEQGSNLSFPQHLKFALDGAFRKFYYEPASGLIRVSREMPYKGSYAKD